MLFLDTFLLYVKEFIGFVGVLVIMLGTLRSLYQLFMFTFYSTFTSNYIRLQFGDAIILGLEFMVGADIVGSLVKLDYYSLGLLGLLVLIRTVLSYFLNLELTALTPQQKRELR